jgi:hypothetical protein
MNHNIENNRERSMRLILTRIAQTGSAQIADLRMSIPLCDNTIYRVCTRAVKEGYLTMTLADSDGYTAGRRRITYTRTKKPYTPVLVSKKTLQNRKYAENKKDKYVDFMPFRHWTDEAFFGAYPKDFVPKIGRGTIYQHMMGGQQDELEEAA